MSDADGPVLLTYSSTVDSPPPEPALSHQPLEDAPCSVALFRRVCQVILKPRIYLRHKRSQHRPRPGLTQRVSRRSGITQRFRCRPTVEMSLTGNPADTPAITAVVLTYLLSVINSTTLARRAPQLFESSLYHWLTRRQEQPYHGNQENSPQTAATVTSARESCSTSDERSRPLLVRGITPVDVEAHSALGLFGYQRGTSANCLPSSSHIVRRPEPLPACSLGRRTEAYCTRA
jgi:hypothetical protein